MSREPKKPDLLQRAPRVAILHFNKQGSVKGFPWTVHVTNRCIPAREVVIKTPITTVFKPEKAKNPRAWIRTRGVVEVSKDGVVTIS